MFKQFRLNMWVASLTRFIPEHIYNLGNQPVDMEALKGRDCYLQNNSMCDILF